MTDVHSSALVEDSVQLGKNVTVGPNSVLQGDVRIGDDTTLKANVHIRDKVVIGSDNTIEIGTVIGTDPQDWSYEEARDTGIEIGDENIIREYVTINKATADGEMTRIGNENMIMAYCHIAHDCVIGSNVDMANGVNLAGHVTIGNNVVVSGHTGFHQFIRVGDYAMVGGLSRIVKDVVPYSRVSGNPLEVYGLNSVGLKRNGFDKETRHVLKRAFKMLFRSDNNTTQALELIKDEFPDNDSVSRLADFIENSERGIHK
ncbi:MAG: acyl-ACP--UDP-N-acetylglucosamine O-acyltransferase [bacterium]